MLIKKLRLKNFKRFTDLEIVLEDGDLNIPRLVLLTGVNGSGKSSIFDAFEVLNHITKLPSFPTQYGDFIETKWIDSQYYCKNYINNANNFLIEVSFEKGDLRIDYGHSNGDFTGKATNFTANLGVHTDLFYGRTAFRYTPKITKTTIGTTTDTSRDADRPSSFIDMDVQRFSNDLDTFVVSQLRAFSIENPKVKSEFNSKFNNAFKNIFGLSKNISLQYVDYETPADGKPFQFTFKKSGVEFNYDLLSAGEKMVFELLFNLYSRKSLYQDSIIFLDEIDLHLNTGLQKNLLKEITENWIPEGCQLWVASHSLGFIDYAREYKKGVIIDLDSLDFDEKQVLKPIEYNNRDVYNIAVPFESIAILFKDKKKIYCENKNEEYYNGLNLEGYIFLPEVDKNSIFMRLETTSDDEFSRTGLVDRDFLSDDEVVKLKSKYRRLAILDYYCFENYIWHPNNIKEIVASFNIEEYKNNLITVKNNEVYNILTTIKNSRDGYIFFKKYPEIKDKNLEVIINLLRSDNFEDFYKFFSMKGRGDISNTNLSTKNLSKTNWFKEKISSIIFPQS